MSGNRLGQLEDEAWAGFLRTHERIWRAMEAGLAPLDVSMAEYDVLIALAVAGRDGVRMSDLAQRRLMSSGGFTRLADRLEKRGLLERRPSAVDKRSFDAVLTRDGRNLLRRAQRQHHSDVRRLFLDRLEDDDLDHLADIWVALDPAADQSNDDPEG